MAERVIDSDRCRVSFTPWGGLVRLDLDGLSMLQYPASEVEPGAGGLWLRTLDGPTATPVRLADPSTGNQLTAFIDGFALTGEAAGLHFSARFSLHPDELVWQWMVTIDNRTEGFVELDFVMAADIALAPFDIVRVNQYYVSQYLDVTPLRHDRWGDCLAVRQNMPGPRAPWVLVGCFDSGVGWATDAQQLAPDAGRLSGLNSRRLPNARLQQEHTLAVIASRPVTLGPGESHDTGFFGLLVPDHPAATGADDVRLAPVQPLTPAMAPPSSAQSSAPQPTLFADPVEPACTAVEPGDLSSLIGEDLQVVEQPLDSWWEALAPSGEVLVSAAKERAVLRPHGHILRTGASLTPDPAGLTTTVWMNGVFASHLTVGHVGRVPLITATRSYVGLMRAQGLRLFVEHAGHWLLLGQPSAWGLLPNRARWWYAWADVLLQVSTEAEASDHHKVVVEVTVIRGDVGRIMAAAQLADEGSPRPALSVSAGDVRADWPTRRLSVSCSGGSLSAAADGPLFADGQDRGLPWVTVRAEAPLRLAFAAEPVGAAAEQAATDVRLSDQGDSPDAGQGVRSGAGEGVSLGAGVGAAAGATAGGVADVAWRELPARLRLSPAAPGGAGDELAKLDRILPWFTHNAGVHYLSPRGLEQFSGGAWGTRDVCQGPVGLLTAYGEDAALRDLLLRVLQAQHERGDWPQAFEFLSPHSTGQPEAHGDVLFWPLLAVGEYLVRTQDGSLLAERLTFVGDLGPGTSGTVLEHLARALALVEARTVPGSPLPAYGHGDWNDSLQPADPLLAAQMTSAWTATLQVQSLRALGDGLTAVGDTSGLTDRAVRLADDTETALTADLLVDDLLAGYGVYGRDGDLQELLVHPRDARTGLHYGVLPWIHAISAQLLQPAAAQHHLRALESHLLGPDGARLFDRPPPYRGGPMRVFQRAEAATFWGREIGLMYTHAHLRYAEALARVGDAPGLLRALCQVNPIGVTERIGSARPRQSTCYYSSSDAAFADREDAERRYPGSLTGEVPLEGGWRVYSSGPGLFLRLVVECLLGVGRRGDDLLLDPVLDPELDGMTARVPITGRLLRLQYQVRAPGHGVRSVSVAGRDLPLQPMNNRYRPAGARLALAGLGPPDGSEIPVVVRVGDE